MAPIPSRRRSMLRWLMFGLLVVGTVVLLTLLYLTTERTLREAGQNAVERASREFEQRATDYIQHTRLAIIAELAAFHEEGLAHALNQWNEANQTITRADLLPAEGLPRPLQEPASYEIETFSTIDTPGLPADLGYQNENLESLRYAGRVAEPAATWAAHRNDPRAPWIVWYRTGPAEPIRLAEVDISRLMLELHGLLPSPNLATAVIHPNSTSAASVLPGLPAHRFEFGPGVLTRNQLANARLIGTTAALLLAALLAGVALLIRQTQRDTRDALRKTTFVSLVSHELRTPVTSIRMFADMLADPALPDAKRQKFTATIQRESARLGHLIERLLSFNALEKRATPPPRQPVELSALITDTLETATPPLATAGLTPVIELPDQPVTVATDAECVRQTLHNLLDNAAKYAPRTGDLRITLSTTPHHACLTVADRGPGITAAQRIRLFEPFVQGHDQLTDKPSGLGLGLALSRAALRSVGGELELLPPDPTRPGATFAIRLPLA